MYTGNNFELYVVWLMHGTATGGYDIEMIQRQVGWRCTARHSMTDGAKCNQVTLAALSLHINTTDLPWGRMADGVEWSYPRSVFLKLAGVSGGRLQGARAGTSQGFQSLRNQPVICRGSGECFRQDTYVWTMISRYYRIMYHHNFEAYCCITLGGMSSATVSIEVFIH